MRTHEGNPTITQTTLAITQTLPRTTYEKRGTGINETINELTRCSSVRYTTTKNRQDDDTKTITETAKQTRRVSRNRTNEAGSRRNDTAITERPTSKRRHELKTDERRYSGSSRIASAK